MVQVQVVSQSITLCVCEGQSESLKKLSGWQQVDITAGVNNSRFNSIRKNINAFPHIFEDKM